MTCDAGLNARVWTLLDVVPAHGCTQDAVSGMAVAPWRAYYVLNTACTVLHDQPHVLHACVYSVLCTKGSADCADYTTTSLVPASATRCARRVDEIFTLAVPRRPPSVRACSSLCTTESSPALVLLA